MRLFAKWPAFMSEILLWVENAVTLKPITDKIFDYGSSKFELANQKLEEGYLEEFGITDRRLSKGLGIFAIFLFVYVICIGIYFLLVLLKPKSLQSIKSWLSKKLFYNSALSYLLLGNLKWTIYVFGFFFYHIEKGVESGVDYFKVGGYILVIMFIIVYPLLFMFFLLKYQD